MFGWLKKKEVVQQETEEEKTLRVIGEAKNAIREHPELIKVYNNYRNYWSEYRACQEVLWELDEIQKRAKDPEAYDRAIEERKKRSDEYHLRKKIEEDNARRRELDLSKRPGAVQCPYCKSYDTTKITAGSRVASAVMWGVASNKLGKQWHCNKCKSNF